MGAQRSNYYHRSHSQLRHCDWLHSQSHRCSRKVRVRYVNVHFIHFYHNRYGLFNFAAGLPVIIVTIVPKPYFLYYFFIVEHIPFIHSIIHPWFIHSFTHSLTYHSLTHSFTHLLLSFTHFAPSSSSYSSETWSSGKKPSKRVETVKSSSPSPKWFFSSSLSAVSLPIPSHSRPLHQHRARCRRVQHPRFPVSTFLLFSSSYYAFVTVTTVGYGDITPKTQAGRFATTYYIVSILFWLPSKVLIFPFFSLTAEPAFRDSRGSSRPISEGETAEAEKRGARGDRGVFQRDSAVFDLRIERRVQRLPPGYGLWVQNRGDHA